MAEKLIGYGDNNGSVCICYNKTPLLRVTNETSIKNGTIALDEAASFIQLMRDNYINIHKNDSRYE